VDDSDYYILVVRAARLLCMKCCNFNSIPGAMHSLWTLPNLPHTLLQAPQNVVGNTIMTSLGEHVRWLSP
jgi:hypothetical protein